MTFAQYLRLGLPVWASSLDVIRAARRTILPHRRTGPAMRDARHRFYSRMLTHHRQAQGTYRAVAGGL